MKEALMKTEVSGYECRRGKVRDVYDLEDGRIIIIATDRISAFDVVMENGIPNKGEVLTELTEFWLEGLVLSAVDGLESHLISTDLDSLPKPFRKEKFEGRIMLCYKAAPLPVECVVRGYLAGSAWKEYQETGKVGDVEFPSGHVQCVRLPEPVFTPATKAQTGHDENITFTEVCNLVGQKVAGLIQNWSLELFSKAHVFAMERGLILADTKFEFGLANDRIILIDEVLTPDSSRFWPADRYEPGHDQESFDKQFVRNYLQGLCDEGKWDKTPPGPKLPDDIVMGTHKKYLELYKRLTDKELVG